jgi:hypothetical protein
MSGSAICYKAARVAYMPGLPPPRHIPTLPISLLLVRAGKVRSGVTAAEVGLPQYRPIGADFGRSPDLDAPLRSLFSVDDATHGTKSSAR